MLTGALLGYVMSDRLKMQTEFFEELSCFAVSLKIKIRFSSDTLAQLIGSSGSFVRISPLLEVSLQELKKGESFHKAWQTASEKAARLYYLGEDDKRMLIGFGDGLGVSDTEGQMSHIELYTHLIEERLEKSQKETERKSKVYRLLGILGGMAAAVLAA